VPVTVTEEFEREAAAELERFRLRRQTSAQALHVDDSVVECNVNALPFLHSGTEPTPAHPPVTGLTTRRRRNRAP
jgi:hypothetical protein